MKIFKLILSQILVTLSILICLIFFTDLMPKAKSKIINILNPIKKENLTNLKNQVNEQKQKILYIKEDLEKLKNSKVNLEPLEEKLKNLKEDTSDKLNGLSKNQKVILEAIKEKRKECPDRKEIQKKAQVEKPKKNSKIQKKHQVKKPKNRYSKYKSCVTKLKNKHDNECQKSIKERITNKRSSINKEETKNSIKEEEVTVYELEELPSFCQIKKFQYNHICLKKYYK